MKKQANDVCFPLDVAKAQEKYLKENNLTYPSDEKMLQAINDWCEKFTLGDENFDENMFKTLLSKYEKIQSQN